MLQIALTVDDAWSCHLIVRMAFSSVITWFDVGIPRKSAAVLSGISPLSTTKPDLKDLMEERINDMETTQSSAIPGGVRRKQQKFGNKFNLV